VPGGACIGYPQDLGSDPVESSGGRLANEAGVLLLPGIVYGSACGGTPIGGFGIG